MKFYPFFKPVHSHCSDGDPCSVLLSTGFLKVFDTLQFLRDTYLLRDKGPALGAWNRP